MTARPSRQIPTRASQSSRLAGTSARPKEVCRSSAMAMSRRASNGSQPSSAAMCATVRPSKRAFTGFTVSKMVSAPQLASRRSGWSPWARSSSRLRCAGSARICFFSSRGRNMTSSQPGIASSTKPLANESRAAMSVGTVRATTLAPRSAAWVPASSFSRHSSTFPAVTCMTFQLSCLPPAASDMSVRSCRDSSSTGPPIPGRNSRPVPGKSTSTEQRWMSSLRAACRLGTGRPSASLWVVDQVDENPMAPAASPALRRSAMAVTSASVASRCTASPPMTTRRSAECPTL